MSHPFKKPTTWAFAALALMMFLPESAAEAQGGPSETLRRPTQDILHRQSR